MRMFLRFGLVMLAAVFASAALAGCAPATSAVEQVISPADYTSRYVDGAAAHVLLDVRTPEEFNSGHIPGAVNINVQELAARMSDVPRDVPVIVYCRSGNRSAQALDMLMEAGYTQVYDLGGIIEWQAAGLPVEG